MAPVAPHCFQVEYDEAVFPLRLLKQIGAPVLSLNPFGASFRYSRQPQ